MTHAKRLKLTALVENPQNSSETQKKSRAPRAAKGEIWQVSARTFYSLNQALARQPLVSPHWRKKGRTKWGE